MADYDFLVKYKFFDFSFSFDKKFNIFDPNDKLIAFCAQKAFKLKEDIRVFSDESKKKEVISIQAKQVIDFSAAYDVFDSETKTKLGSWQRKGLQSLVRDSWVLMSPNGNEIAKLEEDSMFLALVRRFLTNLIPQTYYLKNIQGEVLATFTQTFNPFVYGLKVKIFKKPYAPHPKLAMAGAMLLAAIEGRQGSY